VQIDNAMLVLGTVAPPYAALHPSDQLDRCLRYYYEIGGKSVYDVVAVLQVVGPTVASGVFLFPTAMAVPPTITVSAPGDFRVLDANGVAIPCQAINTAVATVRECQMSIAVTGGGLVPGHAAYVSANNTLTARIRLEANPP
jgi:hypothetical protein